MKTLCLLRHAASSRRIDLEDFARPLSRAGFESAHRMAGTVLAEGLVPDLVLCSAARRAQETWEVVVAHLDDKARAKATVEAREDLYLAFPGRLLLALRRVAHDAERVLLIGHNPGLERLARELAGPGSEETARAALGCGYPPAALAVFRIADPWAALSPETAALTRFLPPG